MEHSGIYLGNGQISNIEVDGFAEGVVARSNADSFTSKSTLGRHIYVSCDGDGAVGHGAVAREANARLGERAFYGLIYNNCHHFSGRCVDHAEDNVSAWPWLDALPGLSSDESSWEPTLRWLKKVARKKIGARKWLLWDWKVDAGQDQTPEPEPDWQAHSDHFRQQKLDAGSIGQIRAELEEMREYEAEITDESIPGEVRRRLAAFRISLEDISRKYEEVKAFLELCPEASFSYSDLITCEDNFSALAAMLQDNASIRELARKMGRNYVSEQKKKQAKIPQASKTEVHGTHRSDDLMRMLPTELLNLEDETLESLFYARLLEKNLLSYELQGKTLIDGQEVDNRKQRTGPVVACLDTSGSMNGEPLLKAKALLLAVANILKAEDRSLHVLLFGAAGQLSEFTMAHNDALGLLKFLQGGFGGGTDFETPLSRAFEIIASRTDYQKADVLMISDGDCYLSSTFSQFVKAKKETLNCMVYSVLCAGSRIEDQFSDEILVL
jgi:uncharacterized protein with von Willebrand factor type A (vWA) domain